MLGGDSEAHPEHKHRLTNLVRGNYSDAGSAGLDRGGRAELRSGRRGEHLGTVHIKNPDNNEQYQLFKMDCLKQEFQRQFLQSEVFQRSLAILVQFRYLKLARQIKFQIVIQTALYQLKYKKEEINVLKTNVLDWKKIKQELPKIIGELGEYELRYLLSSF